jgi:hypothetical protein
MVGVAIIKKINKSTENFIKKLQKQLSKNKDVYIDKSVNSKIDREASNLGKEKLIADHLRDISKNYSKSKSHETLFLLLKLYEFNKQVHSSLLKELKEDKKLLNKRIKVTLSKKGVGKDIFKKLMKIGDKHYKFVRDFARNFNKKKRYSPKLIVKVVEHKRKAEMIYQALGNIQSRRTLHKVLLNKLDSVFVTLVDTTADLAGKIASTIKSVHTNKTAKIKHQISEIDAIISSKVVTLREFAYKYSFNVIHSDKFLDLDGNKLVLVTRQDHRHLAV